MGFAHRGGKLSRMPIYVSVGAVILPMPEMRKIAQSRLRLQEGQERGLG